MKILVCDQALLNFGFSVVDYSLNMCNVIEYGLLKLDGKISYKDRLLQIKEWLSQIIDKYKIEIVVTEEIQFQKNVQTFKKLSVLQYVLETVCDEKKVVYENPLQVNVWRTKGIKNLFKLQNGSKQSLYEYLFKLLNFPNEFDSNQADALGMAIYWCNATFGIKSYKVNNSILIQL